MQVFGANFFIDPLNPTQVIDQKGWYLNIAEAEGGKAGRLLCKIPQVDNSMCLQPREAQVRTFHGVEGIHSK